MDACGAARAGRDHKKHTGTATDKAFKTGRTDTTKPKRSKKEKLFWRVWGFLFFYPLLLPALFAYFPAAVTLWLDAWHILFGNLPAIAAFLYEAKNMVAKHGLSMPHSYYIHGFWVYFGWFIFNVYGLYQSLKIDNRQIEQLSKRSLIFLSFFLLVCTGFSAFFVSALTGRGLDLLFEYPDSGRIGVILQTWLGFQFKTLFLILGGFSFTLGILVYALAVLSHFSLTRHFLQLLKHKED